MWSKTEKVNITLNFEYPNYSSSKLHFKKITLNFGTKFFQKEHFEKKTEKMNISIKFFIFKLISLDTKFQFELEIFIFLNNLQGKGISGLKQEK